MAVYTEKSPEGGQIFTRGYENYVKGKKVLVVEDIVTTGGSLLKTIKAVQDTGGNIVSACAMVNKNKDIKENLSEAPFYALSNLFIPAYKSDVCPLCKNGVPVNTQFGHGKKFLESKKIE